MDAGPGVFEQKGFEPLLENDDQKFSISADSLSIPNDDHRSSDLEGDDLEEWNFQNTVAYWASVFFIQGAVLFTVGSFYLFPDTPEVDEWKTKARVDYSYFIGACYFTVGNYLIYFQVINKKLSTSNHNLTAEERALQGQKKHRLIAMPPCSLDHAALGHYASILNLFGAFFYNVSTPASIWIAEDTRLKSNIWNCSLGSIGSFLFMVAAIFEGEHNSWRLFRTDDIPFWSSIFNFFGGALFLVGYLSGYSNVVYNGVDHWGRWTVDVPFLIGSICFIVSSWMSLFMWKGQSFGLGYAREIHGKNKLGNNYVDWKQQFMMVIYISNVIMAWLQLSLTVCNTHHVGDINTDWMPVYQMNSVFKIMVYHCILFLATAIHKTPDQHPYDYLLWTMRLTAVFGFATGAYEINQYMHLRPGYVICPNIFNGTEFNQTHMNEGYGCHMNEV